MQDILTHGIEILVEVICVRLSMSAFELEILLLHGSGTSVYTSWALEIDNIEKDVWLDYDYCFITNQI